MQQADVTLKAKADTSPEAMAKMVEAFAPFGVTKEHIEKRIQRRLDSITPMQVVTLKRIYASLRDEMSEPTEWFEMGDAPSAEAEGAPAAEGSRTASVKSRMKAGTKKKDAPPAGAKAKPGAGAATASATAAPRAADAPTKTDAAVVTYAEVAQALNEATNPDDANAAADLIRHVKDAQQRTELGALYSSRMADLDEDAP